MCIKLRPLRTNSPQPRSNRYSRSLQRSFVMKKFTALALFCLLTISLAQTAKSQTRPRRVNASPRPEQQDQQTQSPTQPQTDSSEGTRPSRPPVLGGANRVPQEQ